jgi:Uma2 family endonuclease
MNAPFPAPARFTAAELERLARSGGLGDKRVELRRGMIVEMGAQYFKASDVILRLTLAFIAALEKADVGFEVHNGLSVPFADDFVPFPDIVVWDPSVAPPEDLDGPLPAAAARLVVEVADSTLTDDLGEKLEDYAKAGLAEYWVADVRGRLILRHAGPEGARYARREPVLFGTPAAWLARPDIVVDTAKLR